MATVDHVGGATASEKITQDPVAPEAVSSGSSAYSQAIGDIAADPSQGSSDAKANSDGTTVTPPSRAEALKLVRKQLITPEGYNLGPQEGWNSSGASVVGYPPNSSLATPRRDNPKSNGQIASLAVPTPRITPEYEHITEYLSLKLYRVSDAVPYLLGSKTLVDRNQAILEHGLRYAEPIYSASDSSPPLSYSDRDRALIAILSGLRTPEFQRRERGNWYPQGLATPKGRLQLYKHTGPGAIKPTQVNLSAFIKMAQAWQLTPNPARFASDLPNAKNSWVDIASKLRARNVDLHKIDIELYYDLTMKCPTPDLPAKLDEVVQWSQDGTLDMRFASWTDQAARFAAASRVTNSTEKGGLDGLYSKRYTHRYPLGRPRSEIDELEKAERRANKANANAHQLPTEKVADTWWGKKKELRRKWMFGTFMALIFGSIIGSMVWAMASHSWDFTPAGATG